MHELQTSPQSTTNDQVLQICSFMLDDTLCGIEIDCVQEINQEVDLTKVPLSDDFIMGIMNLRGQIVTVVNQAIKIGFKGSKMSNERRVIIVRTNGEYIGLMVDQIKEVVQVKTSAIETPPSNIQGAQGEFFKGIVKTGQNELLALVNIERVLRDDT